MVDAWIASREDLIRGSKQDRRVQRALYQAWATDVAGSIDTLGRALKDMKWKDPGQKQDISVLLQVQSLKGIPQELRYMVGAFLKIEQTQLDDHNLAIRSRLICEDIMAMMEQAQQEFMVKFATEEEVEVEKQRIRWFEVYMGHWAKQISVAKAKGIYLEREEQERERGHPSA